MTKAVASVMKRPATVRQSDTQHAHEDAESDMYTCRICFEDSPDTSDFISPCKCIGTQKYVHFKCLRKWQENILSNCDSSDVRAYSCSVCCAPFSVQPPKMSMGYNLLGTLRGVAGALCVSMLAFGLSGPPWSHLAPLAFLLLGTRNHFLLVLLVLLLGSMIITLHARGLRVVLRIDNTGRLGLALIRHGARVDGIRAGSLLVASEMLERGIFHKSVVLLYDHSQRGAKGVILTHPLPMTDALVPQHMGMAAESPELARNIHHFLGGPVGMPGDGPAQELFILHTVPAIQGAQKLLPIHNGGADGEEQALYMGGSLTEVAEKVLQQPAAGGVRRRMWVYHGICAWAGGQLEGELRSSSWGYRDAGLHDVDATAPDMLWRLLKDDATTRWVNV